ncbi:xanthine dehydrogenase small subunit [Geodermatophilus sp. Leaf369]|uniref:xanthine dehydrogenase small subunit n=1 Tax=Geodermatophilus sp. Leaf369 TaxID=1736354 RepID=UPI0006FDE5CC|nr:FAD binding domain-containing protein [Geodermatophilus sp. Leaf369]KQS59200.1 xanthine dehydrogenase small subunit [Geodermatophilus sp. Leaf369]
MQSPSVTVNGQAAPLDGVPAHTTALDWLRGRGLVGAKEGCAEGECGACSVLVARPGTTTPTRWTALNACLVPVLALDGQEVVTAEGLGTPADLHPVQREMAVRGGSQCGYCTPGFVCSMAAEFYRPGRGGAAPVDVVGSTEPSHEHGPNGFDLHALSGNLCRCTGYRPIRDAAYALDAPDDGDPLAARQQQPAPAARATRTPAFERPADLAAALVLLGERPDAVVVAGSTDWGVEVNLRGVRAPLVVAIDRLPELRGLTVGADVVEIGAAVTLSEIALRLDGAVPLLDLLLPQFASVLIRNGATLGGNLGTGSPIGDTAPGLLALGASLVLVSAGGEREVPLADYFTGYRRSVRTAGELIRAVRIPQPQPGLVGFTKIAKRRFDDISSVAVAFGLDVVDGVVAGARIGLGGVAATPIRALATEEALVGRPWGDVAAAADVLGAEGTPLDDHRASAAYRRAMLRQALLKFAAENTLEAAR